MIKNIYFYLTITLFFLASFTSYAQIVNKETNIAFLKQNAVVLQQKIDVNRQKAFLVAKEKGWETLRVTKTGAIIALQGIDDLGMPIYYITDNNSTAAATTNTTKLYTGGGLGLALSGSTIPNDKVAIWDGGAILTTHTEFAPARIKTKDNATTLSSHSTHVAGTMVASGVYAAAKGMSFGLPQLSAFDFNSDVAEMSANAATLLISNHSYGSVAGWQYNTDVTPARWEFWGAINANKDFKFGYYNSTARDWDQICYNAPYYLPVKSAGNSRNENGPAVGEPYYRYNAAGTMATAGNRPEGINSNNGYDILSTYSTAKNILTVGAINPLPFGPTSTSSIQISSFSSWGPTDDGRIKPDLVGDGVNVTSTTSSNPNAYATLSGTSMAAPNVSGSLVLLQELYNQKNAGAYMRSATLKALVLGTATEAGANPGPDYIYGWGLLNAEEAAKAILNKNTKSLITESSLGQGATQTVNLIASGSGPLIATLCWTDPEATPVSTANALDNDALRLVNDLDISIKDNQNNTYRAWVLDPANPSAAATTGDNFRDNVEQVYIANAIPGKSYTLTISHKGTLVKGPQAFSMVVTGIGGTTYCTSAPNSNADSKIINFKLTNIDNTPNTTCTTYTDFTSQTINLEKGKTYPLSLTLGTCGANFDKIAKVFIDWNGDGNFNTTDELVATSTVINTTGVFTTNLTVPETVNVNNFSLLRIVLTETNAATAVSACGTYAKGETQDYRVNFVNPSMDVALKAIINPTSASCANADQKVTVTLKNSGTQTLTSIPVMVTVSENSTVIATLNATYTGTLPYLNEIDFTLPTGFNTQAGKTYTLVATTNLTGDLSAANNQMNSTFQVSVPPTATTGSAYFCTNLNSYTLSADAPANATVFWYKNLNDMNPIEFGKSTSTIIPPNANNGYYVGINDFKADIGPKTKAELGDGGYNQFTPGISVSTLVPITLESARLYIGNSGQIRFTAVNSAGVAVSSVLLNVTATKTIPAAGATANDPADQGQVYALNLTLPSAGSFTIAIEYLGGATIFRNNNLTTTAYPYQTALNLFSITGNTAVLDGSPNYFKGFFYYFYDLKVRAGGCLGGSRLEVKINTPLITQTGDVLSSSAPTGNQWYLNSELIIGATNTTFTPLRNGKYTVEVTAASGCLMRSPEFTVTSVKSANNGIDLKAYPVPTKSDVTIAFNVVDKGQVNIQISNLLGQVVFSEQKANFIGFYTKKISLNAFAGGMYVLNVTVGSKAYTRKILLLK